jgi:hypothetical protein
MAASPRATSAHHARGVAVAHEDAARRLPALVQHVRVRVDHPWAQRPGRRSHGQSICHSSSPHSRFYEEPPPRDANWKCRMARDPRLRRPAHPRVCEQGVVQPRHRGRLAPRRCPAEQPDEVARGDALLGAHLGCGRIVRNRGIDPLREFVIKWMSGSAKWQCNRTLRTAPAAAPSRAARARPPATCRSRLAVDAKVILTPPV